MRHHPDGIGCALATSHYRVPLILLVLTCHDAASDLEWVRVSEDAKDSVAKSTHAGIPWLQRIRNEVGHKTLIWPFDGWDAADGESVIAEAYSAPF
jgi:hypothetical protein